MRKEKVTVYCGEGKGKTTAAFECAVQSASQGGSVIIIQFLKGKKEEELEFLRRLEPELKVFSFRKEFCRIIPGRAAGRGNEHPQWI